MNLIVCGNGRAGKVMSETIIESESDSLLGTICRNTSEFDGKDLGELLGHACHYGVSIFSLDNARRHLRQNEKIDAVIDFSNKEATASLLEFCGEVGAALILCTTGFSEDETEAIRKRAEELNIGVVYAPNLTIGINLLMRFVSVIAKIFDNVNFEIIERHPKDKPQPTATAKLIREKTGSDGVPIHSVRLDGYVGVHEVIAKINDERMTIVHESLSRRAFASAALTAARFIQNKKGFFTMNEVVNSLIESHNQR